MLKLTRHFRILNGRPIVAKMDIKAVTFDLDGVYFPSGKNNFIKALEQLEVSEDEARQVFLKSDEMNKLYKNGKMTDDEFWMWASKEWKLDKRPDELIDLMIGGYDVDQNVVETVKRARANGYKTLVCSNNFPARVNGLQEKFRFLDNFDVAVFSFEVGESKPSEKIFTELVKRADLPAESIIFADDNPVNLDGGESFRYNYFSL